MTVALSLLLKRSILLNIVLIWLFEHFFNPCCCCSHPSSSFTKRNSVLVLVLGSSFSLILFFFVLKVELHISLLPHKRGSRIWLSRPSPFDTSFILVIVVSDPLSRLDFYLVSVPTCLVDTVDQFLGKLHRMVPLALLDTAFVCWFQLCKPCRLILGSLRLVSEGFFPNNVHRNWPFS